jgi:fatty acid desaturase
VKSHHYSQHAAALRTELGGAISRDELRVFHAKSAARHLAIAARQFLILGLTTWALIAVSNPLVWIPLAFVQGFTVFNFTVLLHEVVHHTIFDRRRPAAERLLELALCGAERISASQFTRWHRSSRRELGSGRGRSQAPSSVAEDQRAGKAALRVAGALPDLSAPRARESATYPGACSARIAKERRVSILAHLSVLALIWMFAGSAAAGRVLIPVFFVFPSRSR